MTFSRSTRRVAVSFLARKLVDCCLMRRYLSACLFLQLPFIIRLLAMFGPWAPNGYLLASIPPLGDIYKYIYIYPRVKSIIWPCGLPPHGDIPLALRPRLPPHGEINFLFASRRVSVLFFLRPLTAKSIFYSPHGGCSFYYSSASSRRYFICASRR